MIWPLLLELGIGLAASFVGLMAGMVGILLLGDPNYALMAVIVVIPLGVLTLVQALLFGLWRPRFQRPLRWSLGVALVGALLLFAGLSFMGTIKEDWMALGTLLALVLPAPLLQGLISGVVARIRKKAP